MTTHDLNPFHQRWVPARLEHGGTEVAHPPAPASDSRALSLSELTAAIRRRRWAFFIPLIGIPLGMAAYLLTATPLYVANTTVIFDPSTVDLGPVKEISVAEQPPLFTLGNQLHIIASQDIAGRIVDKLHLDRNDEFTGLNQDPSIAAQAMGYLRENVIKPIKAAFRPEEAPPPFVPRTPRELAIDTLMKNLLVVPRRESSVYDVSFTWSDPKLATAVVNELSDAYVADHRRRKTEAVKDTTARLNARLTELQQKVLAAEAHIDQYRSEAGLHRGVNSTILTEALSEATKELVTARNDLSALEAKLAETRRAEKQRGSAGGVPDAVASDLIRQLRDREAQLAAREAAVASKMGSIHPDLVAIRRELGQVRAAVGAEVRRMSESTESAYNAARGRVELIERTINDLKEQVARAGEAETTLHGIEREAATSRALYEAVLQRSMGADLQLDAQEPQARVLSYASVPESPRFPNMPLFGVLSLVVGSLVGVGGVVLREKMDGTFRSVADLEEYTGVRHLASIPRVRWNRLRAREPYIIAKPISRFSEAIKAIHTALWMNDFRSRAVMITSARAEEGKSSTAVALARLAAAAGERVVIVDCDLRCPAVHTMLRLPNDVGLAQVVEGKCDLADALKVDEATGLSVLVAGTSMADAPRILMSARMREIKQDLALAYDLIVLDTPPTLSAPDAQIVTQIADTALFCVKWGDTGRTAVMAGLRKVAETGLGIFGLVLTQTDPRAASRGYPDQDMGDARYRKYYRD
ncbi:GumC family protein [Azospirillum sp.]|uniref:GumC family protein n=1 Tax=Azospirillum sp. TaxID=34012 RepID=UPI002D5EDD81|nr:AAA family ATPase [Azospirillum sp.]HYD67075.1 AAA family ATPase [Azospirillum sp.]